MHIAVMPNKNCLHCIYARPLCDFSYRMESVPGLLDAYQRKTGMRFFPGTLNVKLDQAFSFPKGCMLLEAHEYGGRVSSNILPCHVLTVTNCKKNEMFFAGVIVVSFPNLSSKT